VTCIVGYVEQDTMWMGSDSLVRYGWDDCLTAAQPKVFRKGDMLIGGTGLVRSWQILQYVFEPPKHPPQMGVMKYLCGPFTDALIACLKEKHHAEIKDNAIRGINFLLAYRGRLFRVASDFQMLECRDKWAAIGSGEVYALAVMDAVADTDLLDGRDKVLRALKTAAKYTRSVGGPFHVKKLKWSRPSRPTR